MPDVLESIAKFYSLVRKFGRNPKDVPIIDQTMITPAPDVLLKSRDLGVEQIVVGVTLDGCGKIDHIRLMLDSFENMIHKL